MTSSFQGSLGTSSSSPYIPPKESREDKLNAKGGKLSSAASIPANEQNTLHSNKHIGGSTNYYNEKISPPRNKDLSTFTDRNDDVYSLSLRTVSDQETSHLSGDAISSVSNPPEIENKNVKVEDSPSIRAEKVTTVNDISSIIKSNAPSEHFDDGKENIPSPLNYRADYDHQNRRFRQRHDLKLQQNNPKNNSSDPQADSSLRKTSEEMQHHTMSAPPAKYDYQYGQKVPPPTSYALPNKEKSYGGDWYDKYYGSYSYEGYHQPYMYYHGAEPENSRTHPIPTYAPPKHPYYISANDTSHGVNKSKITSDVNHIRTTSSSKRAKDSQRQSSHNPGNSFTLVDNTYRDFSGVPPTEEDRERYNNKKKEYARRLKASYDDHEGDDCIRSDAMKKKRGRGNKETRSGSNRFVGFMGTNFPARLHDLLSHDEEISNIITWLPHGRSWIVLDKKEFLKKVAPSHFQISKFESFTRQVNGWGFKRITQGPDINSYYHELFLRGCPHLVQWMKRSTSSGAGRRKVRSDPRDEPDFYTISKTYPIPDYYGESNRVKPLVHHSSSPAVLGASHVHPPQLNSSDCREVLDILVNSDSSPPKKSKGQQEKRKSKEVRNMNPVMYCSKATIPSPIQLKTKRIKKQEKKTTLAHDKMSPARQEEAAISQNLDYEEPLSSKDIEDVKTFWSGMNGTEASDQYYYHQHRNHPKFSPCRTSQPYQTSFDDSYQSNYHNQLQTDFCPSEGTIGDRENFRWDDAEFVRERDESNRQWSQTYNRGGHYSSESNSSFSQDAPAETTIWALI